MGYEDMNHKYSFVLCAYDSAKNMKIAEKLIDEADVAIYVSPDILRLKAKLLMEDNQAVTALDILLNIFDNFQNDLFVVDVL